MAPHTPTETQLLELVQVTALSCTFAKKGWTDQVAPPSPLTRIWPLAETFDAAKHVLAVGHETPSRKAAAGTVADNQLAPPSVDRRAAAAPVLLPPTATQTVAEGQLIEESEAVGPELPIDQLPPPSALLATVPPAPMAMHTVAVGHVTSWKDLDVPVV